MIAVDKGVTQTKDVVFVVRVALIVELKNLSQRKRNVCQKKQTNSKMVTSIMLWLK